MTINFSEIDPDRLAIRLHTVLSDAWDPEWDLRPPLIWGKPENGEKTLIDGQFDLVKIARRILESPEDLIAD